MKKEPSKATDASHSGEGLKVLVVDDEPFWADSVAEALSRVGYDCEVATGGKAGIKKIETGDYDVILTDLRMADVDGLAVLRKAKQELPDAEVVVITGFSDVKTAVEAMQQGAANYITKPVGVAEIRTIVEKAAEKLRLNRANRELKKQLDEKFGFEGVVGESSAMNEVIKRLRQVAPTNATVLILGETGTGKELVAKAIHNNSPRRARPFVPINCTAFNENLLEDELFGHVPGAFTGADKLRKGVFEHANGGTLFLDEVGDMVPTLQAKLLRVLEDQKVQRIGSNEPIQTNVRVLAATHRNLPALIAEGKFRQDLYYRLTTGVTVRLPPLRDRREDIPLLVMHFVRDFDRADGKEGTRVSEAVMRKLSAADWPGNVRELRGMVRGMHTLDSDGVLDLDDLEAADADGKLVQVERKVSGADTLIGRPLAEVERYYIEKTLEKTGGNREEAARLLGIGERTLYRVIRDWEFQEQVRQVMARENGDLSRAAAALGVSEKALQRKLKKLGLAMSDDDREEDGED